jgi:hypothetical protein
MEEDNLIMPVEVGQSKDQAIAEIATIRAEGMKDRKGALMNKSHPNHKQVVQRLADLHRIAYPEMQNEDGM